MAPELVVAVKMRRAVVGRDQDIQVAVIIEITERRAAPHFRRGEVRARLGRHVAEAGATAVQQQMRWLRVRDVGPQIVDGLVDMPIYHQ